MDQIGLPPHTAAPQFEFTAVYTKRRVKLSELSGVPILLTFANYNTARVTREVALAVRQKFPQLTQLHLINVIDLQAVPKLMRGVARTVLDNAFRTAVQDIPPGYDPADYLLAVADWEGKIKQAYRIPDLNKYAAIVLIDAHGRVQTTYQGTNIAQKAVETIYMGQ